MQATGAGQDPAPHLPVSCTRSKQDPLPNQEVLRTTFALLTDIYLMSLIIKHLGRAASLNALIFSETSY